MTDQSRHEARELHQSLEFIGLRAQATTVGLIQLCAELIRAGVLDDGAMERIKAAIHRELSLSHSRGSNRIEFEAMLRDRLDAIFPKCGQVEDRSEIGTADEFEAALQPGGPA